MKLHLTLLFLGYSIMLSAQNKITFDYDEAGNQKIRQLCLNCTNPNYKTGSTKEITALEEEDLQKFYPQDLISYYPNPVKEELYIKWDLKENNLVNAIKIYSLIGQLLKSYTVLEKNNSQNIPFESYPVGIYEVVLLYTDGEQKTIKIIKQ